MNGDPHFVYLQQMERVLGIEAVRMADTDVLPFDYSPYAKEIMSYIETAKKKAGEEKLSAIDFAPALAAAGRFAAAADRATGVEKNASADAAKLNQALRQVETDLVSPAGLPNRPWYRHTIYAPGEFTGYAAVVIPGVTEAIQAKNADRASQQLGVLTEALDRAAKTLNSVQ